MLGRRALLGAGRSRTDRFQGYQRRPGAGHCPGILKPLRLPWPEACIGQRWCKDGRTVAHIDDIKDGQSSYRVWRQPGKAVTSSHSFNLLFFNSADQQIQVLLINKSKCRNGHHPLSKIENTTRLKSSSPILWQISFKEYFALNLKCSPKKCLLSCIII